MQLRRFPLKAQYLFGLDPAEVETMTPEEFCARALAAMIEAWLAEAGVDALTVDYRTLPEAVWERVAPFLKLDLDAAAIARMAEEGRYYAKDPGKRIFSTGPAAAPVIRPELYDLARRLVEPAYGRLVGA
ncbi:MAG: hypothetical protein WDN69_03950 [Aliidongia sp.]